MFVDDVARYLPAAEAQGMATIHATDPAVTVAELENVFVSYRVGAQGEPDLIPAQRHRPSPGAVLGYGSQPPHPGTVRRLLRDFPGGRGWWWAVRQMDDEAQRTLPGDDRLDLCDVQPSTAHGQNLARQIRADRQREQMYGAGGLPGQARAIASQRHPARAHRRRVAGGHRGLLPCTGGGTSGTAMIGTIGNGGKTGRAVLPDATRHRREHGEAGGDRGRAPRPRRGQIPGVRCRS
ncbi:MAG: hypothetical protein ACRDSP_16200 [Pseudonocardiaceae bacterium]